jgi:hypothetical protein
VERLQARPLGLPKLADGWEGTELAVNNVGLLAASLIKFPASALLLFNRETGGSISKAPASSTCIVKQRRYSLLVAPQSPSSTFRIFLCLTWPQLFGITGGGKAVGVCASIINYPVYCC